MRFSVSLNQWLDPGCFRDNWDFKKELQTKQMIFLILSFKKEWLIHSLGWWLVSYTSIQRMKLKFVSYAGGPACLNSWWSFISFGSWLLLLMDVSQGILWDRKSQGIPEKCLYVCSWNNSLNIEKKNSQQRTCNARQVALTTSVVQILTG